MTAMNSRVCMLAMGAATVWACLAACVTVSAQGWMPADGQMFDKGGTVASAPVQNVIPMITTHKAKWLIQVAPGQSEVKVTGTATPAFLHTGLFVRFSGEVNEAGMLQAEIKELEIFTPAAKNSTGVFAANALSDAKPLPRVSAGMYEFRGKVIAYQDGAIQILAGKKFAGKVASDAKITVNVQDITLAQAEDKLAVKGFYYKGSEPSPSKQRFGKALGKIVEITLAKPLTTPPQRGPVKPTKVAPKVKLPLANKAADATPPVTSKEPIASEPSEKEPAAPPLDSDPFGFNKEKK